jgi:hypothetical protein
LLEDPEMVALLAEAPEAAGRILRPLFRMLGVPLPPALRPPRRKRPAQPASRRFRPVASARPAFARLASPGNRPPSARYSWSGPPLPAWLWDYLEGRADPPPELFAPA